MVHISVVLAPNPVIFVERESDKSGGVCSYRNVGMLHATISLQHFCGSNPSGQVPLKLGYVKGNADIKVAIRSHWLIIADINGRICILRIMTQVIC